MLISKHTALYIEFNLAELKSHLKENIATEKREVVFKISGIEYITTFDRLLNFLRGIKQKVKNETI